MSGKGAIRCENRGQLFPKLKKQEQVMINVLIINKYYICIWVGQNNFQVAFL
jgi:hypothetical protein